MVCDSFIVYLSVPCLRTETKQQLVVGCLRDLKPRQHWRVDPGGCPRVYVSDLQDASFHKECTTPLYEDGPVLPDLYSLIKS